MPDMRLPLALSSVTFALATATFAQTDLEPGRHPSRVATDAAVRFLDRATFGSTPTDVGELSNIGYEAWLDAQLAEPPTEFLPVMIAFGCAPDQPGQTFFTCPNYDPSPPFQRMVQLWWERSLHAPDQLRQRVAFALSEIFVVSDRDALLEVYPNTLADYYDTLLRGAFGTYRDLLEDVTLHPAMGGYLSMVKNRKEDLTLGTRPDENFAREVMQLFSIGLVELNSNGTPRLDPQGHEIATYDQTTITEMARALTGWNYSRVAPPSSSLSDFISVPPHIGEMVPWTAFHDPLPKSIVGGVEIPGFLAPETDLAIVLDTLAAHPNVGPFIGRRLIQRLVTSNPSPEYLARVSEVWDDDGHGVRGNLGAVVRAILTDEEALEGHLTAPNEFGKLREPIVKLTSFWRKFDATGNVTNLGIFADEYLGQRPLASPSVFNFFLPDHASHALSQARLVSPELQITTHSKITRTGNLFTYLLYAGNTDLADPAWAEPLIDLTELRLVASDVDGLVHELDVMFTGGQVSETTRTALEGHLQAVPYVVPGWPDGLVRAIEATSLLLISPDYAVQK